MSNPLVISFIILELVRTDLASTYQCTMSNENATTGSQPQQNSTNAPVTRSTRRSPRALRQQKADLVLILDTSGSLTPSDHALQKSAVRKVIQKLTLGPINVRLAIVRFDTQAETLIALPEGISIPAVEAVINRIKSGTGWTNFPDAFDRATEQFQRHPRPGVIKAALLVTDGEENCPTQNVSLCAKLSMDCNEIADKCPRPQEGLCPKRGCSEFNWKRGWNGTAYGTFATSCKVFYGVKSVVFREAKNLKNAIGLDSVTLAVAGIGKELNKSKSRPSCFATENAFYPLPSYQQLETSIVDLVARLVYKNLADNCECIYGPLNCMADASGDCKSLTDVIITKAATSSGRRCPKNKNVVLSCERHKCGFKDDQRTNVLPSGVNTKHKLLAKGSATGIAWYFILTILLVILTLILCVGIIAALIIHKKRKAPNTTTNVQPSIRSATPVCSAFNEGDEIVSASPTAKSRSVQHSNNFLRIFKPSSKIGGPSGATTSTRFKDRSGKGGLSKHIAGKSFKYVEKSHLATELASQPAKSRPGNAFPKSRLATSFAVSRSSAVLSGNPRSGVQ